MRTLIETSTPRSINNYMNLISDANKYATLTKFLFFFSFSHNKVVTRGKNTFCMLTKL